MIYWSWALYTETNQPTTSFTFEVSKGLTFQPASDVVFHRVSVTATTACLEGCVQAMCSHTSHFTPQSIAVASHSPRISTGPQRLRPSQSRWAPAPLPGSSWWRPSHWCQLQWWPLSSPWLPVQRPREHFQQQYCWRLIFGFFFGITFWLNKQLCFCTKKSNIERK